MKIIIKNSKICKFLAILPCPAPELLENMDAKANGTLKVT